MALTKKQLRILEAIVFLMRKGEIPTVREVGAVAGLRSSATVSKHLRALERGGVITISGKSRGIRIVDPATLERLLSSDEEGKGSTASSAEGRPSKAARGVLLHAHFPRLSSRLRALSGGTAAEGVPRGVPIVGAIAAGRPIEARSDSFRSEPFRARDTDIDNPHGSEYQSLAIDPGLFTASGDLVAMKIEGDSMVGAGILDGDYVIIRRQSEVEDGEIAAVLVDGEGTLKRVYRQTYPSPRLGGSDQQEPVASGPRAIRLQPANERFDPIVITEENRKEVLVFGKYVGLVRGDLRIL
jgi:repressor LexA